MVWNMFKVNNKNTRTSFWCFYCWLWTYFTPFSSVSIVDFEQANVNWVKKSQYKKPAHYFWSIRIRCDWVKSSFYLTLLRPIFQWYRNQSIDLLYKSIGWFLYHKENHLNCDKTMNKVFHERQYWNSIKVNIPFVRHRHLIHLGYKPLRKRIVFLHTDFLVVLQKQIIFNLKATLIIISNI